MALKILDYLSTTVK